jgi:hypothetical protein
VDGEKTQGQKNADAYRQGIRDAAESTNFGRPFRTYLTDEEQLSYGLRLYLLTM